MKFGSMNGHSESEVESLFMSTCWGGTQNSSQVDQFLLDSHKLLLEHDLDSLHSDSEQKSTLDVLDNLLINTNSINNALSDLKPLPPFTNYTANLSINGIAGHHYHAIAQRMPDESNNNYLTSSYHQQQVNSTTAATTAQAVVSGTTTIQFTTVASPCPSLNAAGHSLDNNNNHSIHNDHNLVSSSTCLAENILNSENDACLGNGKIFAVERQSRKDNNNKLFNDNHNVRIVTQDNSHTVNGGNMLQNAENGSANSGTGGAGGGGVRIYTDCVDMTNIDELAAIISSAIADTTVNNQLEKEDGTDTRDSWMDLESWIDSSIQSEPSSTKLVVSAHQDSLCDFILPNSPVHSSNPTLHNLLTHGYMPLLQNRLQNGPPGGGKSGGGGEVHSSTSFDMPASASSTQSVSPPVVSTTADNLGINATFLNNNNNNNNHHHLHAQQQQQQQHTQLQQQQQQQTYQVSMSSGPSSIKSSSDGICSPDRLANYPHTTTTTNISAPTSTSKPKRSRAQKKNNQQQQQQQQANRQQLNTITPNSIHFSSNDLSGLLGKEKPVHRCTICNRGFLNKSNIKVHLRTHTGEKPFRCDVCAKAFRQKAHLLKHQQIHKRIGRD